MDILDYLHVFGGTFHSIRPCLIWHHGWAPRHRSSWTKYYQRYGRQPQVTHLVPSVCCNLYTPSATCRSGWIAGRMPIWLFGTLPSRLQEAQMVIREARNILCDHLDVRKVVQLYNLRQWMDNDRHGQTMPDLYLRIGQ